MTIGVEIEEVDASTVLVRVTTARGWCDMLAEVRQIGRALYVDRLHIEGLRPGALGRKVINEIAREVMEIAGVDTLDVHGARRTTGRNPGQVPKPIRFRR